MDNENKTTSLTQDEFINQAIALLESMRSKDASIVVMTDEHLGDRGTVTTMAKATPRSIANLCNTLLKEPEVKFGFMLGIVRELTDDDRVEPVEKEDAK